MLKRTLIVSFLGETDLRIAGLVSDKGRQYSEPDEQPPLFRVVGELVARNLFGKDDAILILDDRAPKGDGRGREFCALLAQTVAALLAVPKVRVEAQPIAIGNPTDLDGLHREAVAAIKPFADDNTQVIFNLTSGTPAMHTTLVLAGSHLSLGCPRFFESSRERRVVEVTLPYMVYVRRRIELERTPNRRARQAAGTRNPLAGLKLPPLTAVGDAAVAKLLGAIARARCRESPIVIAGVTGSAKAYVAEAAAQNAGLRVVAVDAELAEGLPDEVRAMAADAAVNVVVRHLEAAGDGLLCEIGQALDGRRGGRWTATVRTDRPPRVPERFRALRLRLASGGEFLMPPPNLRTDIVELAEHMFTEAGQWPTKVKERFQYELGSAMLADGLHGLRRWVSGSASLAPTRHTDEAAFRAARRQLAGVAASEVLQHAAAALAGGGCAGFPVARLVQVAEHAALLIAEAGSRTQEELATSLGYRTRATLGNRKAASEDAYREFAGLVAALSAATAGAAT